MASTRDIKNRIKSVRDTQKITNAMYLISSTKMRKARRDAERSKPYFDLIRKNIRRMFAVGGEIKSRYLNSSVDDSVSGGRYGVVVITADKGLAGTYNQSIIREAVSLIENADSCTIYAVGEYGRRYFISHGYPVCEEFDHPMYEPDLGRARIMTLELLEEFDRDAFDRLYICYTDFTGGMSAGEPSHMRLLPFDKDDFQAEGSETDKDASTVFEFDPDVETVLETIMPSYLVGVFYAALVSSYSSEQIARMMAMDAANDNASELLADLSLEYNHLRQNAITQEITEVSSGARAKKKSLGKRKKRKMISEA